MRTRLSIGAFLCLLAAVNIGFFGVKAFGSGRAQYLAVRTHFFANLILCSLAASTFLFYRLSGAIINTLVPRSRYSNDDGAASPVRPVAERWGQICATDVIRSVVFLFLLLVYVSYGFYFFWLATEPNALAMLSLCALALYAYLLVFLLLAELGYFIARLLTPSKGREWGRPSSWFAWEPRKRSTVDRLTLGALLVSLAFVLCGLLTTQADPVLTKVYVPVKHLSAAVGDRPIRIALLTDVHIGPSVGRSRVQRIVEMTNKMHPDIVAISGDLADGFVVNLREAAEPLCGLQAKHGVYFATGNHEYLHGDVNEWFDFLRACNITVLHNENRHIALAPKEAGSICIAGIDDLTTLTMNISGHHMDAERALAGCREGEVRILLAHQPNAARRVLDTPAGHELDLVLSGHTHAGQMYLFVPIVYLVNAYTRGLYHEPTSDAYVYVSAGVNYFGPPVKMYGTCEIIELLLVPKGARTV